MNINKKKIQLLLLLGVVYLQVLYCQESCKNPWYSDDIFKQKSLNRPKYLDEPSVSDDLEYCKQWNGEKSCCNKETTDQINEQFLKFKEKYEKEIT